MKYVPLFFFVMSESENLDLGYVENSFLINWNMNMNFADILGGSSQDLYHGDRFRPLSRVVGPLPNGSWLINAGTHPNHVSKSWDDPSSSSLTQLTAWPIFGPQQDPAISSKQF